MKMPMSGLTLDQQMYWIRRTQFISRGVSAVEEYAINRDFLAKHCGENVPALTFWLGRDGDSDDEDVVLAAGIERRNAGHADLSKWTQQGAQMPPQGA